MSTTEDCPSCEEYRKLLQDQRALIQQVSGGDQLHDWRTVCADLVHLGRDREAFAMLLSNSDDLVSLTESMRLMQDALRMLKRLQLILGAMEGAEASDGYGRTKADLAELLTRFKMVEWKRFVPKPPVEWIVPKPPDK